jgi:hypothetical protein
MAVSVVRIWIGAGREPSCAEEFLDLSQNIIHLSGNNPSLQIRLFCGNQRKCYHISYPANGLFSAVLIRHDLHVADCSCLRWNESFKHSLSLASHLLLMPCCEGRHNG